MCFGTLLSRENNTFPDIGRWGYHRRSGSNRLGQMSAEEVAHWTQRRSPPQKAECGRKSQHPCAALSKCDEL